MCMYTYIKAKAAPQRRQSFRTRCPWQMSDPSRGMALLYLLLRGLGLVGNKVSGLERRATTQRPLQGGMCAPTNLREQLTRSLGAVHRSRVCVCVRSACSCLFIPASSLRLRRLVASTPPKHRLSACVAFVFAAQARIIQMTRSLTAG